MLLLYALQSEIRFGSRARGMRSGASDRKSTLLVSVSAAIPVLGFVLAMKAGAPSVSMILPQWFRHAVLPGLPAVAWVGVVLGACGLALRLWALLTLPPHWQPTAIGSGSKMPCWSLRSAITTTGTAGRYERWYRPFARLASPVARDSTHNGGTPIRRYDGQTGD